MIPYFVAGAVVLVLLGGLLAAADSALSVLSRTDLVDLASSSRSRKSLLAIAKDPGPHINAINFTRVVSETTAAVLVSLSFAYTFGEWWWALLFSALIMTAASFILVGSSPRSVGRARSRGILTFTAPLIRGIRLSLGPIANALVAIGNKVTPGRPKSATFSSEEQLLSMVDEATELEVLEEDDRELIHSIFEFNDTVAREIMLPRTDMITIDGDATVGSAMALFLSTGVSRMPVLGETIDDVLGILYLRDLARLAYEQPLGAETMQALDVSRPVMFVPESQKADSLLRRMQLESNHLAMVVDEYGGIAGLVTLEDIIEELVGDISDEYDNDMPEVEDLGNGQYRVSARLAVDELGDLFGIELDDDEVDSVGGLLTKAFGRLPIVGSTASISGLVMRADRTEGRRRRLSTVLVERDQALIDVHEAMGQEDSDGTTQKTRVSDND